MSVEIAVVVGAPEVGDPPVVVVPEVSGTAGADGAQVVVPLLSSEVSRQGSIEHLITVLTKLQSGSRFLVHGLTALHTVNLRGSSGNYHSTFLSVNGLKGL